MVRVDLLGQNLVDILATPKEELRSRARTRIRGTGPRFQWNAATPRLVVTSDTEEFDQTTISHFQQEGFQIAYLPYDGDHKKFHEKLQHLGDPLELGETYAIVAYGDAASLVLEACVRPMHKLNAVVAYYPPYMPRHSTKFPPSLLVQVHIAGSQKFGTNKARSFHYPDTEPGFAEYDMDEFNKIGAQLAWSRTIGVLRKAFDIDVDLETIWDNHTKLEFETKDADATMTTMVKEPYVNHVPVLTGGIGAKDLRRFYADFFIPLNPPDLRVKVLSRTVGVDRVVDEMLVTFTHTTEIPWMLPGVPPTGKKVEVVLVGVICIRGGKLYHEHIHWDQATVLVQVGLLDPKLIPEGFSTTEKGREKELKRLPVFGAEAAKKVVNEDSVESNELIPDW